MCRPLHCTLYEDVPHAVMLNATDPLCNGDLVGFHDLLFAERQFQQNIHARGCVVHACTHPCLTGICIMIRHFSHVVGVVLAGLLLSSNAQAQDKSASVVTVAAASDLKFALEELAAQFQKQSGHKVTLVFGSSGQFTTQLLQGAPFDVFMSADESLVFKLADAGKTKDRGRVYALGRIGVFVPHSSPLKADGSLKDLVAALDDGRLQKLAIANPQHAPYGDRARQALVHAGIWSQAQKKLVMGENIAQAAQFTISGSAQAGIIAQSLALAPALSDKGRFALIDAAAHDPLIQRMVLLKSASPAAQLFYDYLGSKPAQAVLMRYGFQMP